MRYSDWTIPALLCAAALSSACAPEARRDFDDEAGAFLDQGDFGMATRNNHLQMTCRRVTTATISKYGQPLSSGCPGRVQDGKYALFAYTESIRSATEQHGPVPYDDSAHLPSGGGRGGKGSGG
ncbi:hypothetical protein [Tropicimonas sp. IMCC34011]|uniref:hypothetical protein n=1 Tax=Tropicimonas sp. IMCC34011 TaxID=2248759 RepID=UPI000E245F4F|nr:hypothetical protein [Tropicimonas sp. IMCC34011]